MENDAVFLVAFEGIDNCGKTTLVDDICQQWSSYRTKLRAMKELTSELGPTISRGLHTNSFSPISKVLLFAADRQLRCVRDYEGAPSTPIVYLADRWVSSALAYRCAEDPSLEGYVLQVNSVFTKPALTFLIDITAEESISRGLGINKNNYPVEFLRRVRTKYLELARNELFTVVDGMRPYRVVLEEVIGMLSRQLLEQGFSLDRIV